MKHSPRLYAKAFADVLERANEKDEAKLGKNLLLILDRNGDRHILARILTETERLLRKKRGERRIVVESARALSADDLAKVRKLAKPKDAFETAITPDLVAGVRITVDDEEQFDGSLRKKLNNLFPNA